MSSYTLFGVTSSYTLFGVTSSSPAWLGSMTMGLMKLFGPLSSSTLFGTLCVPFALGAAFTITPAMVVPVDYFHKHQTLAMGFVAAGSSIGTLILAPVTQIMLDALNWRTTFRIHSSSLASLVLLNCFMKPIERNKELDELKKPFLNYAGFIGINASRASYIVMAMGGATTVSRLITGKILTCQLLSRLHFKQTIFVVMGTSYLLLAHVTTIEGLYVFAVVRGLLDGAHNVMLPMLTASMVGRNKALLGWGYIAGAISITYTLGPPVAGYVKDVTGNYKMSFTMAGLPMIASGLLLFWLPWAQRTAKVASTIEQDTGSLESPTDNEEGKERVVTKTYTHPESIEALELMPLDVPDLQMKKSKGSISRDLANIRDGQFSRPRQNIGVLKKSMSLPEARKCLVGDKEATKIHSEPMIMRSADFSAVTHRSARVTKRKSGPLMTPSYPDNDSIASGETSLFHLKDMKSGISEKDYTSLAESKTGIHFV
ncbi:hypothetical protein Btru_036829 [Bulinus truncatus]|nr:hypothetical protein Btru_036829 [Bulinus truncatus]